MPQPGLAQLSLELPAIEPVDGRALAALAQTAAPQTLRLTLGEAARIMREAERVKDKSYRSTPIGLEVAHFMRWFRNEYGATHETLRDYEAILAKLAIDHADLELADFEPPHGTTRIREFIDERWGDVGSANAQEGARGADVVLQVGTGRVQAPGQPRRTDPHRRGSATSSASSSTAEDRRPDRRQPARASRPRRAKAAVPDGPSQGRARRRSAIATSTSADVALRVHGKGGKIRNTPIPTEELRAGDCRRSRSGATRIEHLLYPRGQGAALAEGQVSGDDMGEIAASSEPLMPLSRRLHRWWYRCLHARRRRRARARRSGKKMHGARYTSGTEFYLATGDI